MGCAVVEFLLVSAGTASGAGKQGACVMKNSELIRVSAFEGMQIRKILHEGEWWFSVIDVVEILTESDRPRKYWNDLKKKLDSEGYVEVSEKIGQLKNRR
jgi:prophage antirepressor-like protein